jgi:hypothetical protein
MLLPLNHSFFNKPVKKLSSIFSQPISFCHARSCLRPGNNRGLDNMGWSRTPPRASGLEPLKAWLAKKDGGKVTTDDGQMSLHIVLIDTSEAVAIHFRSGAVALDSIPEVLDG